MRFRAQLQIALWRLKTHNWAGGESSRARVGDLDRSAERDNNGHNGLHTRTGCRYHFLPSEEANAPFLGSDKGEVSSIRRLHTCLCPVGLPRIENVILSFFE
jgi:hypothetical protein